MGDASVPLSPKLRDLLAVLLCHSGRTVSADRLIDALWPGIPPRTAAKTLQGYVHHLRRALGPGRLMFRAPGYVLVTRPGEFDADCFTGRIQSGRHAIAAGDTERGTQLIREALDLWRGVPYDGQDHLQPTQAEAFRLTELRLSAAEEWAEAALNRRQHADVACELYGIVTEHPFRERPRAQLMRALHAMGRTVEALEVGREGRRRLAEELGLDPSPALLRLEHAILTHDPALARPRPRPNRINNVA
ncbi:AfsR/SARP family transcriptional regulator [Actinomadura rudentiformis]|uniref:AfsR/SARP family transcriptional regulator n=1 Tax=Actinomadura rudentiformis TaxID=359158 RepID=A0A6H9YHN3_9ACTN|nr:AfsR/SARP family transcriptional regulator [Actinomadura rudentiformis]KAB2344697.1 AfsR/SARP family transcriptional regulator [Actinomadura rudentiformis]